MKVRITFRSEIVIEGENIDSIAAKWRSLPIFSPAAESCGAEFIEIDSVEDAETHQEIIGKIS